MPQVPKTWLSTKNINYKDRLQTIYVIISEERKDRQTGEEYFNNGCCPRENPCHLDIANIYLFSNC